MAELFLSLPTKYLYMYIFKYNEICRIQTSFPRLGTNTCILNIMEFGLYRFKLTNNSFIRTLSLVQFIQDSSLFTIPLTGLTLSYLCSCLKSGPDFQSQFQSQLLPTRLMLICLNKHYHT